MPILKNEQPFTSGDGHREALAREGWLIVPGLLDAGSVKALSGAAEELVAAAHSFTQDTLVRGVGYEVQSRTGARGEPAVFPGALRKITFPSKGHPAFAKLQRDARVVSVLERFGLRAPSCQVEQLNLKLPRVGTGFPFHQDAHFLIGKTRGRIARHGGLNLVIALDAADEGNGGLEMLGRTHHGPVVELGYDTAGTQGHPFDETHRAPVSLAPGDAVVFHPHLAHGSGPNLSDRPRRLITLWFVGGASSSPA